MTKREKVIVSAYTGYLMCDLFDVYKYIEEILGRPVFSHELASKEIQKEIEEKSKPDFLKICNEETELVRRGKWILERQPDGTPYCFHCSVCDSDFRHIGIKVAYDYCPNCGAKMEEL